MRTNFCAGLFFKRRNNGQYEVLTAVAERFMNDPQCAKFPGGGNENSLWETPEQTFVREFQEETGLKPVKFHLVHKFDNGRGHIKYFFVCTEVEGEIAPNRVFTERDGDVIHVSFWELGEFERRLFQNHRPAFMKVCRLIRNIDPFFRTMYPEVNYKIDRFDLPSN